MAIAVIPNRVVHHLLPAAEVVSFLGLEGTTFLGVGPAGFPPTQPVAAEGMDEEVEQTGEADAHNRIPFPALPVALHLEAVVEQTSHRQCRGPEGVGLAFFVAGIDLVEMNLRQVAVEIGSENLAAGIEAVAAEAMLELLRRNGAMVGAEPATGFLLALIAVDLDELAAQFRGVEQISVGSCDRFRSELDGPLTGVELLGDRRQHHLFAGTCVIHPGVIGHAQGIPLRVDAPVALVILLPEVVLG